jgi:hypothetical protein
MHLLWRCANPAVPVPQTGHFYDTVGPRPAAFVAAALSFAAYFMIQLGVNHPRTWMGSPAFVGAAFSLVGFASGLGCVGHARDCRLLACLLGACLVGFCTARLSCSCSPALSPSLSFARRCRPIASSPAVTTPAPHRLTPPPPPPPPRPAPTRCSYVTPLATNVHNFDGSPHKGKVAGLMAAGFGVSGTFVTMTYRAMVGGSGGGGGDDSVADSALGDFFLVWAVVLGAVYTAGGCVLKAEPPRAAAATAAPLPLPASEPERSAGFGARAPSSGSGGSGGSGGSSGSSGSSGSGGRSAGVEMVEWAGTAGGGGGGAGRQHANGADQRGSKHR